MSVFLFPGQGAQKVGMGADLVSLPEVAASFEAARQATGVDGARLAVEGTEAEINDAMAAQVLTSALSVGVARALMAAGAAPEACVGFSLGEVGALIVSGALSDEEGFAFLNARSRALAAAAAAHEGAMLALLGASHDEAQEVCDECADGAVLVCANYNAPGQVVVSGEVAAIERAEAAWSARGKRGKRLRTAGAFHSPLMADAADEVRAFCQTLHFAEPRIPVICNTDAAPFVAAEAADRLARQVESPVKFEQSITRLIAEGQTEFVEVGFGGVLYGLMRRIDKGADRERVGTLEQFQAYTAKLG